jgi:hypothetical protein
MCGLPPPPPMGEAVFFNVTRAATSIYKQSSKVMHDDSRLRHPQNSSDEGGLYGAGDVSEQEVVTPAACLCSPRAAKIQRTARASLGE